MFRQNPETTLSGKEISWNDGVRFIISDVDETVADLYLEADPEMTRELAALLEEDKVLFFVTGQGMRSVQRRVVKYIPQLLRKNILVGHCSGAEVWGFDKYGVPRTEPFYSLYETALVESQKKQWRRLVEQLTSEFKLQAFPAMPITDFKKEIGDHPLAIMVEDRGPQITFEIVNGYDIPLEQARALEMAVPETNGSYDIRVPIIERAEQLFQEANLPITACLAGVFAVDFLMKGVSKTTAVKYVLENESILSSLGLSRQDLEKPDTIEVWGDKFSIVRGGTDRHISEALPKEVRSIDFRQENSEEFLEGYNIVVWHGNHHLHRGLLEYLKSRHHQKQHHRSHHEEAS